MDGWDFSKQNWGSNTKENENKENYAVESNVKSDNGSDFYDKICWIIVPAFSLIL